MIPYVGAGFAGLPSSAILAELDVAFGSNASVQLSRHVGFTPNSGRIAARQRTDASGQNQTHGLEQELPMLDHRAGCGPSRTHLARLVGPGRRVKGVVASDFSCKIDFSRLDGFTDEVGKRAALTGRRYMATNVGFVLSAVIAVGIIFIGGRFLAAPSLAATGYGVPAGTEPHSRAYLSAKGIRDIASGLFAAMLIAYGSAHALGWFMLIATLIPIADAMIVLRQGGSRTIAFGVHGSTAVAMLIISGLLLID